MSMSSDGPSIIVLVDDFVPPEMTDEDQFDSLIQMEEEIQQEQEQQQQEGDGGIEDVEEEGGGFFREEAAASSTENTAAGRSSAASPVDAAESIDEDAPIRPFASGCRECGSIGVQQTYLKAFGVSVCFRCQQIHKNRYSLITQTTATTTYMLPLTLVQSKLGYIEKKNPHKTAWGVMKLYWKQQVLALVRERFGTREKLEEAKRERDLVRIRKDDAKRRTAHQSAARSAAFASTLAASMAELDSQTPAEVVAMLQQRTKGMAPSVSTKDRRRGKKKRTDEEENEGDQEAPADNDPDVIELDRPTSSERKRKKPKTAQTETKKKQLHTHSFVDIGDGRQKCSDSACGFVMEFESF